MNKILKSNSNVLKITFERNLNVNIRRLDNVIDTNQIKSNQHGIEKGPAVLLSNFQ